MRERKIMVYSTTKKADPERYPMRLAARLKLGYYPLPEDQAPMLRARLAFPQEKTSALDPCCGKGTAILHLTDNSER